MVRAALASRRRIGEGPLPAAAYVPAATVVAASLLAILPIVSTSGWFPPFGFLMLIAWRLLRADAWPAWWAAPLGLFNDLLTGAPIGLSMAFWTAAIIAIDLLDRRTMWRDYWVEWGLAAVLLFLHETAEWRVAALGGAPLPFSSIVVPLLIAILCFPVVAWIAGRVDRWRTGQ